MAWGYHATFDCKSCDIDLITDEANLRSFLIELVDQIEMVAYGEPLIEHFATHDPDKAGYSIVQLIETSNITGHFVDKNGDAYIDIFSCKEFNLRKALTVIDDYFHPVYVKHNLMERDVNI